MWFGRQIDIDAVIHIAGTLRAVVLQTGLAARAGEWTHEAFVDSTQAASSISGRAQRSHAHLRDCGRGSDGAGRRGAAEETMSGVVMFSAVAEGTVFHACFPALEFESFRTVGEVVLRATGTDELIPAM